MLTKNKDNFDKNEYDISAVEEEIIIKNPDYKKNDVQCIIDGTEEFIGSGSFKEVVNIDDVINLKLVGAMEH